MWTIVLRAAALLGIGFGAGSIIQSSPRMVEIPPTVFREASSTTSPFLIVAVGILLFAGGYFVWSLKRGR